jgi:catechol 2,3-dioxygenase-like lactoylglutathione lyase family enzyme
VSRSESGEDIARDGEEDGVVEEPAVGFKKGIPSATHVDHIGVTVPDLDEAITFFTGVLGCELVYEVGPIQHPESRWMADQLNVHPRASMRVATLRCGPVTNLEIFEYSVRDQNTVWPKNSDYGGYHIAFFVTDIEAAVAYLREQPGVTVLGQPQTDSGLIAGNEWVYFLTPWGMQMEVRRWGRGLPYERTTNARMFGPGPCDPQVSP